MFWRFLSVLGIPLYNNLHIFLNAQYLQYCSFSRTKIDCSYAPECPVDINPPGFKGAAHIDKTYKGD